MTAQANTTRMMDVCRLCQNDRELRNSHIVPEFFYRDLYNSKHQMRGIDGRGANGGAFLQKGLREHLFCESCERHFNDHFEKPFLAQWIEASPLPDPWTPPDIHWIKVDYVSFKLFHLSVLFRAGVSSLPTFGEVSLGPHEEKLRALLLNRNAGESWQYPVLGYAVVHDKTNRLVQMVSKARQKKSGGRRCYGMMYGGVQWWVCVASDRNTEFEQFALRPDGLMPFTSVPWNEVFAVQEASFALKTPAHSP